MWKYHEATNLLSGLFLLFVLSAHLLETARALSDKRLCADEHCKVIISQGYGKISYIAGEEGLVSFQINSPIRIVSKGAGSKPSLWGIVVNNREGYAPKEFIVETRVFVNEKKLIEVDVVQKNKVVLSSSEKLVEQDSTAEATTTKPLNRTPEQLVNRNSDAKISAENLPVATTVLSEVVDGTVVPISGSNENILENIEQSSNNNAEGNKNLHQDIVETEIKPETTSKPDDEVETFENSKQQMKNDELKIREESKPNENANAEQEDGANLKEPYIENVFKNENNSSKTESILASQTNATNNIDSEEQEIHQIETVTNNTNVFLMEKAGSEFSKLQREDEHSSSEESEQNNNVNVKHANEIEVEAEAEKTKRSASSEAANGVSESLFGLNSLVNENIFNSSALASKDQKTNSLDDVKSDIKTETEINLEKPEENVSKISNDLINENPVGEYASASQNSLLNGDEKDNTQNNAALKDIKEIELNSINQISEDNTNTSIMAPAQEVPSNDVENLKTDFNKTHLEPTLASTTNGTNELDAGKEEQNHQTENPILQTKMYNETVTDRSDDVSVGKTEHSSDKETTTGSYEINAALPNHEFQYNGETIVNTNELPNSTETNLRKEHNPKDTERNDNEIDLQKMASNITQENSKADDSENNPHHVSESTSTLIEDSYSTSVHNQQEINNEVYEDVPLQQSKEDTVIQITESMPYYKESIKTETVEAELVPENSNGWAEKISSNSASSTDKGQPSAEMQSQIDVAQNINPTTSNPIDDIYLNTPLPTYEEDITTSVPQNDNHAQYFEHSQENADPIGSKNSAPTTMVNAVGQSGNQKDENAKVAPSLDILEAKENKGLFATIMGTVNNMLTNNRKKLTEFDGDNELDRLLYSQPNAQKNNLEKVNEETSFPYCKNIEPNGDCPESSENHDHSTSKFHHTAAKSLLGSDLTVEAFLTTMASKILEMSQLIAFLGIAAAASLFFVFGYYCFCNSSREGALLLKLNQLESSLLASHKENAILKHNLMSTRQKLASIEDNSFGSNDMVASLKKELEEELLEKARLQEQTTVLQKELENAADAGIELNKIVSDLLSNQTGDESIISSVEELQKQLNEQQNTIYEINASLAEKSRENSELQLMIAEQHARYEAELANVQRDNDELEHEKGNLLTKLEEIKTDFDKDITVALEGKNMEIKRLQNDILDLNNNLENEHTKWQTSVAKIEALEECLQNVRRDPKVNISEVIDVANVKAQLIEAQKRFKSLKERFETELDTKKLVESQLEVVSAEVEKLKQDFNQSEKDKLEAQTRLEVLSNYFKDKENQLQKELSLKEAMWLKQQGETTTTVDRVTAMQEEIQSLKSQNDSLRAEIEAQLAAHKAQIGTLENRAHETWLAARQSDRRYEEARAEATALRRKLTALAGGTLNETNKPSVGPVALGDELTQAPSPIHMESPGSPIIGRMPPPPFLPPPFMGPPPPFMGMPPPPPFVPPGEMRPAPLGRIMSPPPQRSGRFSPQHLDYEDYLDYEGNNTWQRYTYSPPPRTYRSLSPTDSRYNYGTERDLISTYDTETDFSPPPSPRESRRRVGNSSERIDSNAKISYGNTKKLNSSNKAPLSSGSEHSFNAHSNNDTKIKKGNAGVGGKSLV